MNWSHKNFFSHLSFSVLLAELKVFGLKYCKICPESFYINTKYLFNTISVRKISAKWSLSSTSLYSCCSNLKLSNTLCLVLYPTLAMENILWFFHILLKLYHWWIAPHYLQVFLTLYHLSDYWCSSMARSCLSAGKYHYVPGGTDWDFESNIKINSNYKADIIILLLYN